MTTRFVHQPLLAGLCALLLTLICPRAQAQNVSDGFNPNADDNVYAVVLQTDGKILLGGAFKHVGGVARTFITRLNADGKLDIGFNAVITGSDVRGIALQADGKIVICGDFTQVGATAVHNVARLNTDGSVDATFTPMADGSALTLAVQSDGKVLVGGYFNAINGQPTGPIVRLNTNGSMDTSFMPPDFGVSPEVTALLVQPDGRILIGGFLYPDTFTVSVGLLRLFPSGALDSAFQPALSNGANSNITIVNALALQVDDSIVFGGAFTSVGGYPVQNLARVHADGSADFSFDNIPPLVNDAVSAIAVQPSGEILIGGLFNAVNSTPRSHIARVSANGALGSFSPYASDNVFALALQSDSELLVGGEFSVFDGPTRHHIARVDVEGNLDATLLLGTDQIVSALAPQANGGLLIGGNFNTIGTTSRRSIARIVADGSLDPNYHPILDGLVSAIAQLNDGSALVAGYFLHVGTHARAYLAHLTSAGGLDTSFAPVFDGTVAGATPQPDGKILVYGGAFNHIDGAAHPNLGRLNADGSLDSAFNPGQVGHVFSVALAPGGQILIGGDFNQVAGHDINALARLNADGSIDATFAPTIAYPHHPNECEVLAIVVQADGKILIGGPFSSVDGQTSYGLARLNSNGTLDTGFSMPVLGSPGVLTLAELADGKILVGGIFQSVDGSHPYLARLNADGTLDESFADLGLDGEVYALAIARDGKIVIGGEFQHVSGIARTRLARLSMPDAVQQSLNVNGGNVSWLRSGSFQETSSPPTLFYSSDNNTYAPLGAMVRIAGGWQYAGLDPPVGKGYWLRVQAPVAAGFYGNSQGVLQYSHELYLSDDIFKDGFGG